MSYFFVITFYNHRNKNPITDDNIISLTVHVKRAVKIESASCSKENENS